MGFMRRGNYEKNTIEIVVDHVRHTIRSEMEHLQFEGKTVEESAKIAQIILASTARRELILEGRCFVGITANPMQSLSAHGINIFTSNTFFCMDIPKEDAAKCKEAVMALEGYKSVSNSETDCYETPFSQLYLYIYKITEQTNENPEIKEMVPLQTLPEREITIRTENRDGTANPISEWTPWDKNDCRYLYIFKNWETEGFAKESAKSHECLMQEPEPPRITIKHIWEIN